MDDSLKGAALNLPSVPTWLGAHAFQAGRQEVAPATLDMYSRRCREENVANGGLLWRIYTALFC